MYLLRETFIRTYGCFFVQPQIIHVVLILGDGSGTKEYTAGRYHLQAVQ